MLTLYAGQKKRARVWKILQDEGWAFRDRQGQPSPIEKDDIRRVVSNFAEYGGYVSEKRARERHPSEYPPDEIIAKLNPERAVFSVELLAQVARSRQERAIGKHPTNNVNSKARVYPLAGITYCAHCEAQAQKNNNPKLRSLLSGHLGLYYRHKPGGACGCTKKSVQRDIFEEQFLRIIKTLEIKPESIELMNQLALQMNTFAGKEKDFEQQKTEAIALCNLRIQRATDIYYIGKIDRDEYYRLIEQNEREILAWQARTTKTEELAMQLGMCVQAVDLMNNLWQSSGDEDKQGMARHLFDYILFDLDMQQIVDFRLKAWADQFLQVSVQIKIAATSNGDNYNDNPMTLTGDETVPLPTLNSAVNRLLDRLYWGLPFPIKPITEKHVSKQARNQLICARYSSDESLEAISEALGLSHRRVYHLLPRP